SDIAGFSQPGQQTLGALVRCQRRGIAMSAIQALPERLAVPVLRCVLLLRLSVLLHRSHDRDPLPQITLTADAKQLKLRLPGDWLATHPLTHEDLNNERNILSGIGYELAIKSS
ncbi:MAG: exopolyphosphatase, partial [Lysobacteraceae bacterium]